VNVLVDTSVWSLVFRRPKEHLSAADARLRLEVTELVKEGRVQIIGPVRQELLSGIRNEQQYTTLKERLRAFPDEPLETTDYEQAARVANACRAMGISGSSIDFLICAAALERRWQIFSSDIDFRNYARAVKLTLYSPATR
jgi:predicted nucleic acid-binding protein